MASPVYTWIFAFMLLGVVPAIFFYFLLEPWRALRKERRDILVHGQAAIGTVVAIDEVYTGGRSGPRYAVTVEFTPPNNTGPVQFQINCGASEVSGLGVYQKVPIHYREPMPMDAVIDELVR
jgi:hypothetical protein